MVTNRDYYRFAVKWQKLLHAQNDSQLEVDSLLKECLSLEFSLDQGNDLDSRYHQASTDPKKLAQILPELQEIQQLGSWLYAKCFYWSHWAGAEKIDEQAKQWYSLILASMQKLAAEHLQFFQGTPVKLKLTSGKIGGLTMFVPGMEYEQRLTVTNQDQADFRSVVLDDRFEKKVAYQGRVKLEPKQGQQILQYLAAYFSQGYEQEIALDAPAWEMELFNSAGEKYQFSGFVIPAGTEFHDFSETLRQAIDVPEFDAFDGQGQPERPAKLFFEYEYEAQDGLSYHEKLALDRAKADLKYSQASSAGSKISFSYHLPAEVGLLLDVFTTSVRIEPREIIFDQPFLHPGKSVQQPEFQLELDYLRQPAKKYSGTYDEDHLPGIWKLFLEQLTEVLKQHSQIGFLEHGKHSIIFYSVTFTPDGRSYYYLSDDDSLEVGETVLVPVGPEDRATRAQIVKIESFAPEEVPLLVKQTKYIIGKAD
ncbi:hypothetical protein LFYK43_04670 [Ligilactobacillus salitolerans]|uniref:Uncharacterized protein n=1 Tax=Ligilactobacillus salitolerans TaxID=1808352 RepID=A0A401IR46_9LACO|nr:hypothetical protein [Ligilactobacillus salitolerans]GBG94008.1 hypothetical protein LFYK43_04670 [Ligilactobacillus salitolerans]